MIAWYTSICRYLERSRNFAKCQPLGILWPKWTIYAWILATLFTVVISESTVSEWDSDIADRGFNSDIITSPDFVITTQLKTTASLFWGRMNMLGKMLLSFVSVAVVILTFTVSHDFLWITTFSEVILKSSIHTALAQCTRLTISEDETWLTAAEVYWGNGVERYWKLRVVQQNRNWRNLTWILVQWGHEDEKQLNTV